LIERGPGGTVPLPQSPEAPSFGGFILLKTPVPEIKSAPSPRREINADGNETPENSNTFQIDLDCHLLIPRS
jgi:hypothetical protein